MSLESMGGPSFHRTGTRLHYTRGAVGAQFALPIPPGRVHTRQSAKREAQIADDRDGRGEGRAYDTPSLDCTACPALWLSGVHLILRSGAPLIMMSIAIAQNYDCCCARVARSACAHIRWIVSPKLTTFRNEEVTFTCSPLRSVIV